LGLLFVVFRRFCGFWGFSRWQHPPQARLQLCNTFLYTLFLAGKAPCAKGLPRFEVFLALAQLIDLGDGCQHLHMNRGPFCTGGWTRRRWHGWRLLPGPFLLWPCSSSAWSSILFAWWRAGAVLLRLFALLALLEGGELPFKLLALLVNLRKELRRHLLVDDGLL
jgi:hypothetical protein